MAASGFSFGSTPASSSSLFGAKPTQSSFSFGNPGPTATSGLGATKAPASGFNLSAPSSAKTSGFSFSTPANSTSTGFGGGGLFGAAATSTASTTGATGLFGKTTGFNLSAPSTSLLGKTTANTFGFGTAATSTTNTLGFGTATTTATSTTNNAAAVKVPENVKEAIVPAELYQLVDSLETHIKSQNDIKDEISKTSSEGISKTKVELSGLKQAVALIGNAVQRNSIAVENLKLDVTQELKNAEICQQINHVSASLHDDVMAPIQYFQRLVLSFESRINNYRQEIEELEAFLTSTAPAQEFTPQDLSNILRRLNESFVGLASELHQIHEVAKCIKEKYLHYRRVVYNDMSDPFVRRKKRIQSDKTIGPSPFPVIQGAGIMASAFKTQQKVSKAGVTASKQFSFSSNFSKPTGLTRSLSFDGSATKTGLGGSSFSAGGGLFGKPTLAPTNSLNLTGGLIGGLTLQKPPTGKRGRIL